MVGTIVVGEVGSIVAGSVVVGAAEIGTIGVISTGVCGVGVRDVGVVATGVRGTGVGMTFPFELIKYLIQHTKRNIIIITNSIANFIFSLFILSYLVII
jgi:hypothetical protein